MAKKISVTKALETVGGPAAAAKALGLPGSVVWNWCDRDSVPPDRVIAVSKLTGIPPHQLRPDVFSEAS